MTDAVGALYWHLALPKLLGVWHVDQGHMQHCLCVYNHCCPAGGHAVWAQDSGSARASPVVGVIHGRPGLTQQVAVQASSHCALMLPLSCPQLARWHHFTWRLRGSGVPTEAVHWSEAPSST